MTNFDFIKNYYSGIGTIFMLHRVSDFDKNKLFPNENLKISPGFLEKTIIQLINNNYEFISIERLCEILMYGEKLEKKIVFTLDDGYLDNFEIAYPIFDKYNVPFTVYVTSGFIDKTSYNWWHDIEEFILSNNEIYFNKKTLYCSSYKNKLAAFYALRDEILNLKKDDFYNNMNSFYKMYSINYTKNLNSLFMNWNHLKELSSNSLVTIGSHTVNHLPLKQLTKKEIESEILEANKKIELKIKRKVNHFAYPYGTKNEVGSREFEIVKNMNFKSMTTGRHGNFYNEHINYLDCIPRISLTENFKLNDLWEIRRKKIITI